MFLRIVIVFLTAFSVCFLLGAWQGWEDKRSTTEDEFLIETAVAHMHFTHLPETAPDPNRSWLMIGRGGDLQYVCNGASYFTFDLPTLLETENSHPVPKAAVTSFEGLEKVFEGATGFHLYELSKGTLLEVEEAPEQLYEARKVIITVAGAVSGYFAGRSLTSRQRVPCDSPKLIEKLADSSSRFAIKTRREFCRKHLEGVKLKMRLKGYVALVDLVDRANVQHHLPLRLENQLSFLNPEARWAVGAYPTSLFISMAQLRGRMALTDYKPTSQEYMMAALLPTTAIQILSQNPKAADEVANLSGEGDVAPIYDGPYDPGDIIASYEHINFFSEHFLLFVLWLSVGTTGLFLVTVGCLAIFRVRKNETKTKEETV